MEKIEDEEVQLVVTSQKEIEERITKFIVSLKGREVSRKLFIEKLIESMENEDIVVSERFVMNILKKLESEGLLKLEKRKIKIM